MLFRLVYDDLLAQAAYLIGCQRSGEALLVDPGRDIDRYVERAGREKLKIVAVTETHIHADFLSGARQMAEDLGVRLYLSAEGGPDWQYEWARAYNTQFLKDGDRFAIGQIEFRTVHSPGHTPEHVSFLVTDRGGGADEPMGVISGDFVFVGALGRPDLLETAAGVEQAKEPSARQLAASARDFLELPDHLQVWPAHGAGSACGKALGAVPQSTVGYERRFNSSLGLARDEDRFVESVLEGQTAPPLYFGRMKAENRKGPAVIKEWPVPRREPVPAGHGGAAGGADGPVVVDTRPWAEFRKGHLPGAIFAPMGPQLCAIAGSYVLPEQDIHLIVSEADADPAVRGLIRIGLDRVGPFSTPEDLAAADGLVETAEVDAEELYARRNDVFILDVRGNFEYSTGAVEGSRNIPHTRLLARLDEVPKGGPVWVYCLSGGRSAFAASLLQRRGYEVCNVRGGMTAWKQGGFPTVMPESVKA